MLPACYLLLRWSKGRNNNGCFFYLHNAPMVRKTDCFANAVFQYKSPMVRKTAMVVKTQKIQMICFVSA
jgi:hypothetical protein